MKDDADEFFMNAFNVCVHHGNTSSLTFRCVWISPIWAVCVCVCVCVLICLVSCRRDDGHQRVLRRRVWSALLFSGQPHRRPQGDRDQYLDSPIYKSISRPCDETLPSDSPAAPIFEPNPNIFIADVFIRRVNTFINFEVFLLIFLYSSSSH